MATVASDLVRFYTMMARHRAFEEATARAYAEERLPGLLHLSIGAEAATVGVISQLDDDDRIFSAHRPHGHFLVAGESPVELFAELAGRETGLCRGRGGSMHLMGRRRAVMATGVVGGTLPIALGHSLALAKHAIAVVFFGDGAVQTGLFHETLNMAALWRAPVLFACENNARAEFTSREEHTTVARVADYGAVYGIAAEVVDGTDVRAVCEATRTLTERARAGAGPGLLELQFARLRPHYETRAALGPTDGVDPLERLRGELDTGVDLEAVDRSAADEMANALETALAEPLPDPGEEDRLVFAQAPSTASVARRARSEETVIAAVRDELAALMADDDTVVVLGEDVAVGGPFGLTRDLAERFGVERVRNTPISEASAMGVAIGLALAGRRPVLDIMFDDFLTLASDQLFNHAAKIHHMSGGRRSVPLCIWTTGGAGTRWGAQHSQRMDGWLTGVPGLKVLAPTTPAMAAASIAAAVMDPDPVVVLADRTLLYRRWTLPGDDGSPWENRLVREGSDVTIAASGRTVALALEVIDAAGVSADVVDLQRIAPLDVGGVVASVERTSRLVVAHDEAAGAGLADRVVRGVYDRAFWSLDAPVQVVTAKATPVPAAPVLEDAYQVQQDDIADAIERVLTR